MSYGKRFILLSLVAVVGLALALHYYSKSVRPGGPGSGGSEGDPADKVLLFYCAAGVKPPVLEAAQKYEKDYGVRIQLQYGGSGTLLSNIQVSHAGDLYLAADNSYIDIARAKGVVAERIPVAYMRPVIAVRKGNPKGIRTPEDLLRKDVRVSLGNPDAASIGKQTKTLLEGMKLWEAVNRNVTERGVFKPTVPDVANDIKIGAVDAGIVWDATVNQYPELEAVEVPAFQQARKQITVAVIKTARQPTEALRFARYLNSTVGNAIFRKNGYDPVDGDVWELAPELTFFCGSVNRRSVDNVLKAFEKREGIRINTLYNGCGILTGQMRAINQDKGGQGFPDTYMACDRYYLETVKDWFQEDVNVSEADIVIAVPKGNPKGIKSLKDLGQPGLRVVVGQPDQCTIGVLTKILLQKEGVYAAIKPNIVKQAPTSAMIVPDITTKSADAALAYVTDTRAESDKVDVIPIDSPYALAVQPFSIAKSSRHKYLARRLFEAIAAAKEQIEAAGFRYRLDREK